MSRVKRKKSGVGGNLCILKYCFERSAAWKKVLAEEADAQAIDILKIELDDDPSVNDAGQTQIRTDLGFGPLDGMHLTSFPLVRARVVKLLKHSPHYMHTTQNLLVTLVNTHSYFHLANLFTNFDGFAGFRTPDKDRATFLCHSFTRDDHRENSRKSPSSSSYA